MEVEERLTGGNVGEVVRVSDTVRRAVGVWSPAVHELLEHLEAVGFAFSPRFLGMDDRGREVLTYLDGETVGTSRPWPAWAWSEETLTAVARMMRDYHDAVATFRPSSASWRFMPGRRSDSDVICHNDIAPYNIVVRDGRLVGVIDWDLAGPGAAVSDLAFAAWTVAPISTASHAAELGAPLDVGRRLRLLVQAYGLADAEDFLERVAARMAASINGIRSKAAEGDPAFVRLVQHGHVRRMEADAEVLTALSSCALT